MAQQINDAASAKPSASRAKMVLTTLDSLSYGTEIPEEKRKERFVRSPLPEGVSHRMLYKDILNIAWPSFVELVLTQLTSMADQIMVGQLPGEKGVLAISAVGLCSQPKVLLMTMIQALNVGSTALVARYRGQHNREKANQVFRQSLLLNLLLSAFFMIVGILVCDPFLHLIGGSEISAETYVYARQYFLIQMYGFIPLCLTITVTAVLRGIGDTRTPLIYNTLANVINVIFNYLLIYGKFGFPEMGVAGASLATIIGQCAAFVFAFIFISSPRRYTYLSVKEKFRPDKDIFVNVVNIGIPSMIEQLFLRAGIILYTRTVTNLGDMAYATHMICMNIMSMSFMTGQSFGNATTTLIGQSLGKRRYDMADNYTRHAQHIGWISSTILGILLIVFGRTVVGFYNQTPEIINMGGNIMIMIGIIQPFQSMQFVYSGSLRGAGDTRFPAIMMFITVLVIRTSLAILLVSVLKMGLWGAWYALVADQLGRSTLLYTHYLTGKWRFIKLRESKA